MKQMYPLNGERMVEWLVNHAYSKIFAEEQWNEHFRLCRLAGFHNIIFMHCNALLWLQL